jgi:hypothetical protein
MCPNECNVPNVCNVLNVPNTHRAHLHAYTTHLQPLVGQHFSKGATISANKPAIGERARQALPCA